MDDPKYFDLVERAMTAMANGDHVRALALADQAAAHRPEDASVRNLRAQVLLNMGSSADALEEAERAVELAPDQPEAHLSMAMAAWEEGRTELAQRCFERGLELSGREAELLARFAWFMACERGPRIAAEAAEEALQKDPGSVIARSALALTQLRRQQFAAAEESLRQATTLDPEDIHAQSVRLELLERQGRTAEVEQLAQRMAGQPGTEELVQAALDSVRQRRLRSVLSRRGLLPQGGKDRPFRWPGAMIVMGMFSLSVVTLVMLVLLFPTFTGQTALVGVVCLLLPLVLLLLWFRE